MLAWRRKSKLAAFKLYQKFTFSATAFPDSSFPQCRRDPTSHILQCIVTSSRPEISGFFQKGFSNITEEAVGKAMHAVCLKGWTELCVFHMNTMINMYSKSGNIKYAEQVFDRMPVRNDASWNNLMAGYVKEGLHTDACGLFIEMRNRGFDLNRYNIPSLLTAVSRSGDMLSVGLQIHGLVLKNALIHDVFVGTSLLHYYGGCGLNSDARMLFEDMPDRNVVSWTSLMDSYEAVGLFDEVVKLFRRMRFEGKGCDWKTFCTVVNSCGALGYEFLVHQVLGHLIKSGHEKNVFVANSLVSVFGSLGRVEAAAYIFNNMDKCNDTMLWNTMLVAFAHNRLVEDSLRYFCLMRLNHGEVDENMLSTVLSIVDTLKWGKGIHGLVVKMGLEFDIHISNTLLTMYFRAGRCQDAENLFYNLPNKDLVSWNSMMAGYLAGGKWFNALMVLGELLCMGNIPNIVTFATALSCCANAGFTDEGKSVHALVITSGLGGNIIVANALVTMYGKCGQTREATKVFQNMTEKELVSWNALIGGYAKNGEVDEAIKTFNRMRKGSINPDYVTLIHVLESCRDLTHGIPLHAHIFLTGFESDEYVRNSLTSMYGICGDLDSINSIFCSSVLNRTTSAAAWNAMVSAMAHNGQWEEALKLFRDMQRAGVGFDKFSLSTALSASANLAILEQGQQLHAYAIKLGFDHYNFIANASMDMYGKCGELNYLLKMLPGPEGRSRLSWNIFISALARHGLFHEAKEVFNEMVGHGVCPDDVTFVALLSACNYGGLVDDGLAYIALMTNEFGIPAGVKHCVCVVNLLGRCGRLAEAEAFIESMPVPPNDQVWRTLLAACEIHGHVELGKKAAEHLLEANPSDDTAYILYSNVCASSGRWEDVKGLRFRMRTENVVKKQACSWVN